LVFLIKVSKGILELLELRLCQIAYHDVENFRFEFFLTSKVFQEIANGWFNLEVFGLVVQVEPRMLKSLSSSHPLLGVGLKQF